MTRFMDRIPNGILRSSCQKNIAMCVVDNIGQGNLDKIVARIVTMNTSGKPPGLVVNVEDSRSEPWSLDVGSNPGLA